MLRSSATHRPSATVVLLRDATHGLEVFMQRRAPEAAFLGGAYVFPGGALDPGDALALGHVAGMQAAAADARLAVAANGLAYWVAAVRECYEEAGILFAEDAAGRLVAGDQVARLAAEREALNAGALTFGELLERYGLAVAAHRLLYWDHWITPAHRPRRYDTRFFVAAMPEGQEGLHDNAEAVHSAWWRPADALEHAARGEIEIAFATRCVLKELASFPTADAVLAHAAARPAIETNRPVVAQGAQGQKIFRRGDPAYAEIVWSDPDETTRTSYDLVPGVAKRLDRFVTRIIAPNPGAMTGPGTNTYLVGTDTLAVVDPGPAVDSHVAAILACGGERIRWIVCSHTHRDHSPAAQALHAATGARIVGRPAPPGDRQDATFAPDWIPAHRELLRIGGATLRALHTPGHASNHLCFLLEETRMLFSGDHIMQGSTVIINPPDGDMRTYLQSLADLLAEDIAIIAPGHGYLIGAPQAEIRRLIAHRLAREGKVVTAVERCAGVTCDELLPIVYADVPPRAHPAARRSLLAHLDKLVAEQRVTTVEGRYYPA